jgi:hypothetical protein
VRFGKLSSRSILGAYQNTFSPADVSGLLSWWKADTGVLNASDATAANTDPVKTWQDQSGNARHLQQGTAGNRPIFNSSSFSQPVIEFDETGPDFLITTTTQPSDTPPFTVFILWAPRVGVNNAAIVFNTNQAGVGAFFLEDTGTDTFYLNSGSSVLGVAYTPGSWAYSSLVYNGASSKHYKDGVQQGTTANPGARNLAGFCLGAYITGGDPTHMYVAECLIYNAELSAGDLASVHAYLASRLPA